MTYRRGMDWIFDLLTTYIHHSELHYIDHWHTQPSVLSLLQSPLTVSWQRFNTVEILQLPALRSSCHSRPCRTLLSSSNSVNCVPSWRSFHTNLLVSSSRADFQIKIDNCNWTLSPTSYFTTLNWLQQGGAQQSSSLLPAASQHGHSWHRAPLGPMAIYFFHVKTFVFFLLSLFLLW
jgi:hypothetical protein